MFVADVFAMIIVKLWSNSFTIASIGSAQGGNTKYETRVISDILEIYAVSSFISVLCIVGYQSAKSTI
jgi:hypothetical protein